MYEISQLLEIHLRVYKIRYNIHEIIQFLKIQLRVYKIRHD